MQRQFLRLIKAPAGDEQVIAETLEAVDEVVYAATLEVGA